LGPTEAHGDASTRREFCCIVSQKSFGKRASGTNTLKVSKPERDSVSYSFPIGDSTLKARDFLGQPEKNRCLQAARLSRHRDISLNDVSHARHGRSRIFYRLSNAELFLKEMAVHIVP